MQLRQLHRTFLNEMKLLYNNDEAAVITSMVFESLLGIDKLALLKQGTTETPDEWKVVTAGALQQLHQHVPVQYVTGTAWFCNLPFKVNPSVLIPRPETEELVQKAITFLESTNKTTLLDIGTGSGCIPISIKKHLPKLIVSAMDVSKEALLLAKENGNLQAVEINWLEADLLQTESWTAFGMYDVITSNPPYIPLQEKDLLDKNVTAYEPHLALFVPDEQPLIFYENIVVFGKDHLAAGGKIFMETHEKFAQQVANLFTRSGYAADIEKDFYGKERMVIATRSR